MQSDFLTAIPTGSGPANRTNKNLLRGALVKRVIYPFSPDEDPQTWTAEVNGSVPLAVANEAGGLFFFDEADGATGHDGVTVIVSADGKRYKISNMRMPDKVLGVVDEAPVDPEYGDAYIVSSAPDGADFAYHPDQIAVFTIRGWLFIEPQVGRPVYIVGSRHYFMDEFGNWVATFAPAANSIRDTDLVNVTKFFVVESSTLNVPPGAPGAGVYWRIGGAPTGVWAGQANKIATKYAGDTLWTFFTPTTGMMIYDKVQKALYAFDGAAWVPQAGALVKTNRVYAEAPASTNGGTGGFAFDASSGPNRNMEHREFTNTLTIAAAAGSRIDFSVSIAPSNSATTMVWAIFRDNEFVAPAWEFVSLVGANRVVQYWFSITTADASSHVYKFRSVAGAGIGTVLNVDCAKFAFEYKVLTNG